MSQDTNIPIDPTTTKTKEVRTKQVIINMTLNDQGTVDYDFIVVRETVSITTVNGAATEINHKSDVPFTPSFQLVKNFVGANLPTGKKAVDFWEAFGDSLT